MKSLKKFSNGHNSENIWWTVISKQYVLLFDLGLTSLSTFFSHIATVPGCGRELNAHF